MSSDNPSAVDLIGVERDVETLAELIAAAETSAPLAIALIGEWGAGKSSVMEQVQAEIDRLADMSRNNPGVSAFATSVCQVRFNAWHYSSDHLWAGVARNMFQTMSDSGWLNSIGEADPDALDRDVLAERAERRAELADCEKEGKRLSTELDKARRTEAPGGFLQALGSPSYVLRTFAYAYREAVGDIKRSWVTLTVWAALAALFVAALVYLGSQINIVVALIAGALGSLLPILQQMRLWHRLLMGKTTDLFRELERKERDLERKTAEAQKQLALIDAQFRLSEFVRERGNSAVYRQGRGLIGDVHEDLLLLSENLRQARVEWEAGDRRAKPPERIVLFIDDLDRCPPERVVEVLEAVHLILSLDLFVVVVAVDARWLIRSLEAHYNQFFGGDGSGHPGNRDRAAFENRIDPYDYLDKIFQIPYTLVPPNSAGSARYLRALLPEPRLAAMAPPPETATNELRGSSRPKLAADAGHATTPPRARSRRLSENGGHRSGAHDQLPAKADDQSSLGPDGQNVESRTVTDLQPPSLRLSHAEVEFMTRLGTLTPSPRTAKRMANLYRLVRISIPDEKLPAFLGDVSGGPYRVVQVLLAILTGSPNYVHEIFEKILNASETADLLDVLKQDNGQPVKDGNPIKTIGQQLRRLKDESGLSLQIAEYQGGAPSWPGTAFVLGVWRERALRKAW